MADHSITFEVDSTKAVAGAEKFSKAISNIKTALSGLDTAFAKTDKALKGKSFNALSKTIKDFNSVKVSASALNSIRSLGEISKGFKAPTDAQAKNLRSFALAMRQLEAPKGAAGIAKLATSLHGFKAPSKSQTTNLKQFVTTLNTMKVPTNANAIASSLSRITSASRGASAGLSGLRGSVSKLGLDKLTTQSNQASNSLMRLGGSINVAAQGGTILRNAFGALTIGSFTTEIFKASNAVQTFNVTMKTVSGSTRQASQDLAFVRDLSKSLAIDLRTAQEQFASFAAASQVAGLEASTTRDIFKSVSIAMTVLNRSTEDQKLSFLALQQMISKGTVSSEELRRQLGERLPGALEIMARALKVSGTELNSMLKAGSILSKDALPKFAKELELIFGGGVQDALKRTSSQLKLLRNDFEQVLLDVGDAGFMEALTEEVMSLRESMAGPEFQQFVRDIGVGLANALHAASAAVRVLVDNAGLVKVALQAFIGLKLAQVIGGWVIGIQSMAAAYRTVSVGATAATASTGFFNGATIATSVAAKTTTLSLRALSVAIGPVGWAILGVEAALTAFNLMSEKAVEHSDSYRDSLNLLGSSAESAQMAIGKLSNTEIVLKEIDLRIAIPETSQVVDDLLGDLKAKFSGASAFGFSDGDLLSEPIEELNEAALKLDREGSAGVQDFINTFKLLKSVYPDVLQGFGSIEGVLKKLGPEAANLNRMTDAMKLLQEQTAANNKEAKEMLETHKEVASTLVVNDALVKKYSESFSESGGKLKTFEVKLNSLNKAYGEYVETIQGAEEKSATASLALNASAIETQTTGLLDANKELSYRQELYKKATADAEVARKTQIGENVALAQQAYALEKVTLASEAYHVIKRALNEETKKTAALQRAVDFSKVDSVGKQELLDEASLEGGVQLTELLYASFKKLAPEFAEFATAQTRVQTSTEDLNMAMDAFEKKFGKIDPAQRQSFLDNLAEQIGGVASLGLRTNNILDEMYLKLRKSSKVELVGRDKAVDNAQRRFEPDLQKMEEETRLGFVEFSGLTEGTKEYEAAVQNILKASENYTTAVENQVAAGIKAGKAYDSKETLKAIEYSDKQAAAVERLTLVNAFLNKTDTEQIAIINDKNVALEDVIAQANRQVVVQGRLADPLKELLRLEDEETKILQLAGVARRDEIILRQAKEDIVAAGIKGTEAEIDAQARLLAARRIANDDMANPTGINAFIESVGTAQEAIWDLAESISNNLVDATAEFLTTGKFNFRSFANDVLKQLARIAAQQVFKNIFTKIGFGALLGSGSEGGYSGALPGSQFASFGSFAGAPSYAQGTANTSGIPSILHDNEAVIPLSKNRKVPVELTGGGDSSNVFAFSPNIQIDMGASGGGGGGGGSSADSRKQAEDLAKSLEGEMNIWFQKRMMKEAKAGGLFDRRDRSR